MVASNRTTGPGCKRFTAGWKEFAGAVLLTPDGGGGMDRGRTTHGKEIPP
jgi:hypothetical protein